MTQERRSTATCGFSSVLRLPDIVCVMPLTCTTKEVCFHRSILSHLSLVSDVAPISGPILFVDCRLGAV